MQDFYDETTVQRYVEMIQEEYNPNPIVFDILCSRLENKSLLLELGSRLEALSRNYQMLGSGLFKKV